MKRTRIKDLTNQKFGKLLIINQNGRTKNGEVIWRCLCDCGEYTDKSSSVLLRITRNVTACRKCTMVKMKSKCFQGYEEITGQYWNNIQRNAKARNHLFDITIEEGWELFIKQERKCVLTGVELIHYKRSLSRDISNASLDRIDSLEGYTIDNVRWVDKNVNLMRIDYSDEEFIHYCTLVVNHHKDNMNNNSSLSGREPEPL